MLQLEPLKWRCHYSKEVVGLQEYWRALCPVLGTLTINYNYIDSDCSGGRVHFAYRVPNGIHDDPDEIAVLSSCLYDSDHLNDAVREMQTKVERFRRTYIRHCLKVARKVNNATT